MVYLTCAVIDLGGWGEITHGVMRQHSAPLKSDVRSHLSGSSAIQPLAASEESWQPLIMMQTIIPHDGKRAYNNARI